MWMALSYFTKLPKLLLTIQAIYVIIIIYLIAQRYTDFVQKIFKKYILILNDTIFYFLRRYF